jgi:GNAT superfamily N-acetyltransferase
MKWVIEDDLAAYGERVLPWLQREPVQNTVQSTVLLSRIDGTIAHHDLWLAWLADPAGAVAAVALRTPPRGLLISALPPGAAGTLAEVAPPGLPGASGRVDVVGAFAAAYAARTGATAVLDKSLRLYRLTEPARPGPVPGRLRVAGADDVDLCARWFVDFTEDAHVARDPDSRGDTARVVASGRMLLWEVDGRPVAMVGHSVPSAGVTRVGPVWTPPEHRRHGYATAATAELAGRLRERGEVVLYADDANPTSTGIYLRIGFRPVGEWQDWRLEY